MKKNHSIATAAGLLSMLFVSCNMNVSPEAINGNGIPEGMGLVKVELQTGGASEIKAGTAYVEELPYEKSVNSVQLFFFDSVGNLLRAENIGKNTTATFQIPVGPVEVWGLVNFKDITNGIRTLAELKSYQVLLKDNSLVVDKGFLMYATVPVEVEASKENKITLLANRYASRISLASVTNSMPGGYETELEHAFLINVATNSAVDCSPVESVIANPQGRVNETSHIIDGDTYKSEFPDLLYKDFPEMTFTKGTAFSPEKPYCFYAFPGVGTSLVVVATLNGTRYYYPVPIENMEVNKAYTVYLTLLGPGSEDPNQPVAKSAFSVDLKVQDWQDGGVISPEI